MDLRGIDLSGKPLPVVEFLPGSGKFGNHQVTGHSQFGSVSSNFVSADFRKMRTDSFQKSRTTRFRKIRVVR